MNEDPQKGASGGALRELQSAFIAVLEAQTVATRACHMPAHSKGKVCDDGGDAHAAFSRYEQLQSAFLHPVRDTDRCTLWFTASVGRNLMKRGR